jgi:hypothetical protein
MTTIQHPGNPLDPPWVEEFIELVCSHPELAAAEFAAIIAAEWPTLPPACPPLRCSVGPRPAPGHERWGEDVRSWPGQRPRGPGTGEWARQRSPPRRVG